MNLSFHRENIFSCWTHITPFLMQLSVPMLLEECSELAVLGPPPPLGGWTRCREKSSSVKALEPSPGCGARSLEAGASLVTGAARPEALRGESVGAGLGWWCGETARGIL